MNHQPDREAVCNGMCLTGYDIGLPSGGIAYPHPMCPAHGEPHEFTLGRADRIGRLVCAACGAYQTEHEDQMTPALLTLEAEREEAHGHHEQAARLHGLLVFAALEQAARSGRR